jgi:hypothetical protein
MRRSKSGSHSIICKFRQGAISWNWGRNKLRVLPFTRIKQPVIKFINQFIFMLKHGAMNLEWSGKD